MKEANIVVEGTVLTDAQAATVRVALSCFRMQQKDEGLGEDGIGKALSAAYVQRADEVLALIHQ